MAHGVELNALFCEELHPFNLSLKVLIHFCRNTQSSLYGTILQILYPSRGCVFDSSLAIVSPLGFRLDPCVYVHVNWIILPCLAKHSVTYIGLRLFVGLFWVVCRLSVNGDKCTV